VSALADLQQEHAEHGIGPELARLLARVVKATAVTYPASEYSDAAVWNREALEDALHDWIETRLIGRGDLTVMLGSASSVGSLRSGLTRSFGQFLTNRRRRSSASNLYKRTLALLREDEPFRPVGSAGRPSEQLWTLTAEPAPHPSALSVSDLAKTSWELSDEALDVVRYGPHSLKSSPILREPKLRTFIAHLLSRAGGSVNTADLFEVIRHRFNLVPFTREELDEQLESGEPSVMARVERRQAVESILARIGDERRRILEELVRQGGDVEAAASSLGTNVGETGSLLSDVMDMIADYAESLEEAIGIYRELTESLFL
jgi:hypothetical protein